MKGNFNNLMKQAQAMQANMQKAQAEIASIEVVGEAGGGMVKVTMNGRHEVKRVQIEPAVSGEDREMLEDLIAAAANDAVHKVEARVQEKMAEPHRRPAAAAGNEAAVLKGAMKHSPHLARLIEALRTLPGVGPKTAQRMAFHLLQEGAPGARAPRRGARCGAALGVALPALPHAHRGASCASICAAPQRDATLLVRGRVARGRGRDRVLGQLPRPLLRAHGAPLAARWHRA